MLWLVPSAYGLGTSKNQKYQTFHATGKAIITCYGWNNPEHKGELPMATYLDCT